MMCVLLIHEMVFYGFCLRLCVSFQTSDLEEYIKEKIWQDPLASDLQWSLFLAAMNSYRHDTVLRPFPPMYQSGHDEKDHEALVK